MSPFAAKRLARSQYQLGVFVSAVVRSGLAVSRLSRDQADERSLPGVRLATMLGKLVEEYEGRYGELK